MIARTAEAPAFSTTARIARRRVLATKASTDRSPESGRLTLSQSCQPCTGNRLSTTSSFPRATSPITVHWIALRSITRDFATGRLGCKFLLLSGPFGVGKTHLAAAVINHRMNEPQLERGKFAAIPEMLQAFRAGFRDNTYQDLFDRVRNSPLLVLDDLGAEYHRGDDAMSWASEQIYLIVNHRYSHRLPTVVTTNVSTKRIEGRILDRLMHTAGGFGKVVVMEGPSYRSLR